MGWNWNQEGPACTKNLQKHSENMPIRAKIGTGAATNRSKRASIGIGQMENKENEYGEKKIRQGMVRNNQVPESSSLWTRGGQNYFGRALNG